VVEVDEIENIDEEENKKETKPTTKIQPKTKNEEAQVDQNVRTFLQTSVNLAVIDFQILPSKNGKILVVLDALGRPALNVSLYLSDETIEKLIAELEK